MALRTSGRAFPSRSTARLSETPTSSRNDSPEESNSDKENSGGKSVQKRRSTTRRMDDTDSQGSAKRRRIERTQPSQTKRVPSKIDSRYYDPNQDPEERRRTKRALRDLHSKLNDSHQEFLQAESTGLIDTLKEADKHFENIKQTADATVDSRLLVAAADLSYKKINTLTLGDSSVGVDVDDFVTKCISFMRRPGSGNTQAAPTSTQGRRRQQADEEDDDDEDIMNWGFLGRNASIMYNSRPALSGFLLGPLSVQKRAKRQTQRRAREERAEPTQHTRALRLTEEELDTQEKQNLTVICAEILRLLESTQSRGEEAVQREYDLRVKEDMSEGEVSQMVEDIMEENDITKDTSVPLFKFCVNPKSFGQTIENLFYTSFLIKEGKAWLGYDQKGMPTIGVARERSLAERQTAQRNQAVFTMSYDIWDEIVENCGLEKCIIPHREDQVYDDGVLDNEAAANDEEAEDSDMYD